MRYIDSENQKSRVKKIDDAKARHSISESVLGRQEKQDPSASVTGEWLRSRAPRHEECDHTALPETVQLRLD